MLQILWHVHFLVNLLQCMLHIACVMAGLGRQTKASLTSTRDIIPLSMKASKTIKQV
jgi:hypothetical protein